MTETSLSNHLLQPRYSAFFWLLAGTTLFALIYSVPKLSEAPPSVAWIVFFRYAGGFLAVLPFALRRRVQTGSLRRSGISGHLARAGAGLGAGYCMYYAVLTIPVADAVAISMTEGAICLLLAAALLKEPVGGRRMLSVLIAMTGGFVVANPTSGSFTGSIVSTGALAAAVSAVFMAFEAIIYRYLATREDALTIVVYLSGLSAAIALPIAMLTGAPGSLIEYWPILLMGPIAALAQVCNVRAYALADASFLQPFVYAGLPIAGVFAYFLLGDIPTVTTWAGGVLVISGAWIALGRSRRVRK